MNQALSFSKKRRARLGIHNNNELCSSDALIESQMNINQIEQYSKKYLTGSWSNRAVTKLFKVARTLADIEGSDKVRYDHLDEVRSWKNSPFHQQ